MPLITCLGNLNCWGLLNRNHMQIDSPKGARSFWDTLTVFKSTISPSTFTRTKLLNVNEFQTGLQTTHRIICVKEAKNWISVSSSSVFCTVKTQVSPDCNEEGQDKGWGEPCLLLKSSSRLHTERENVQKAGSRASREGEGSQSMWFTMSSSHSQEQSEQAEWQRLLCVCYFPSLTKLLLLETGKLPFLPHRVAMRIKQDRKSRWLLLVPVFPWNSHSHTSLTICVP